MTSPFCGAINPCITSALDSVLVPILRVSGRCFCYNFAMKLTSDNVTSNPDCSGLSNTEMVAVINGLQQQLASKEEALQRRNARIEILEELLRHKKIQQFAASSEKQVNQILLFDEAELEIEIDELRDELPERIELTLSEAEKAGASKTFFTKVKEELVFIPAQLKVLEYWQEKAVFEQDGEERIVAAARPTHPLGKCIATPSLLAYLIISKYADGLPLYRQAQMFKRLGQAISRTCMAYWIIRLDDVFKPLIHLIREVQNGGDYLQADETRIQVLKEDSKTAQSDKWMWVTRGGPPDQPSVLFEYDPSRGGQVPVRLLDDFKGILQADGYSGYGQVCRDNGLTRIGWLLGSCPTQVRGSVPGRPEQGQKTAALESR